MQVAEVQLEACQGGIVAEDGVGPSILGFLLLRPKRFLAIWMGLLYIVSRNCYSPSNLIPPEFLLVFLLGGFVQ